MTPDRPSITPRQAPRAEDPAAAPAPRPAPAPHRAPPPTNPDAATPVPRVARAVPPAGQPRPKGGTAPEPSPVAPQAAASTAPDVASPVPPPDPGDPTNDTADVAMPAGPLTGLLESTAPERRSLGAALAGLASRGRTARRRTPSPELADPSAPPAPDAEMPAAKPSARPGRLIRRRAGAAAQNTPPGPDPAPDEDLTGPPEPAGRPAASPPRRRALALIGLTGAVLIAAAVFATRRPEVPPPLASGPIAMPGTSTPTPVPSEPASPGSPARPEAATATPTGPEDPNGLKGALVKPDRATSQIFQKAQVRGSSGSGQSPTSASEASRVNVPVPSPARGTPSTATPPVIYTAPPPAPLPPPRPVNVPVRPADRPAEPVTVTPIATAPAGGVTYIAPARPTAVVSVPTGPQRLPDPPTPAASRATQMPSSGRPDAPAGPAVTGPAAEVPVKYLGYAETPDGMIAIIHTGETDEQVVTGQTIPGTAWKVVRVTQSHLTIKDMTTEHRIPLEDTPQ